MLMYSLWIWLGLLPQKTGARILKKIIGLFCLKIIGLFWNLIREPSLPCTKDRSPIRFQKRPIILRQKRPMMLRSLLIVAIPYSTEDRALLSIWGSYQIFCSHPILILRSLLIVAIPYSTKDTNRSHPIFHKGSYLNIVGSLQNMYLLSLLMVCPAFER